MSYPTPMLTLGADVYRKGWVVVALRDGAFEAASVYPHAAELVAASPDAAAIGLDIPIGLPTEPPRQADVLARKRIGPRRSSVFPALPWVALDAADYDDALARCRKQHGTGISKQAFALRERIAEVDALVPDRPHLYEVHPEVTFAHLAGAPLAFTKKSWSGQARRRGLLKAAGVVLPEDLGPEVGAVPPDDLLDAAACAVTAYRIATGVAESLPSPVERNSEGREMGIWY